MTIIKESLKLPLITLENGWIGLDRTFTNNSSDYGKQLNFLNAFATLLKLERAWEILNASR